MRSKIVNLLLFFILVAFIFSGCGSITKSLDNAVTEIPNQTVVDDGNVNDENALDKTDKTNIEENNIYSKPEEVAEYIHIFGKLPKNYITKKEAMELGWESSKGNLWDVTDKKSIGGDSFGNREGRLPKASGRKWYECDVNYNGGYRGGERIVFSNDGLIYYTDNHYETFKQLY